MEEKNILINCDGLVKIYKSKDVEVMALQGLDLNIEKGEMIAIIGKSGSGKSTLMNMLGGLERPTAGKLFINGEDLYQRTDKQMVEYRKNEVGFVWQNNGRNLIPYLTVLENIMLPMGLTGTSKKKTRALELLERVGLSHKKYSRMNMLSGGEMQRIAIAIALANSPELLLADEPTGSVDSKTGNYIFDIFSELNNDGQTILIVTHDMTLSKKVRRVVAIRDGQISSERVLKESYLDRVRESNIDWSFEETQDEYTVLDRAHRIQIPPEMLKELNLEENRVRMRLSDGKIIISK